MFVFLRAILTAFHMRIFAGFFSFSSIKIVQRNILNLFIWQHLFSSIVHCWLLIHYLLFLAPQTLSWRQKWSENFAKCKPNHLHDDHQTPNVVFMQFRVNWSLIMCIIMWTVSIQIHVYEGFALRERPICRWLLFFVNDVSLHCFSPLLLIFYIFTVNKSPEKTIIHT